MSVTCLPGRVYDETPSLPILSTSPSSPFHAPAKPAGGGFPLLAHIPMAKVVLLLRRGVQASALVLLPAQTTAPRTISVRQQQEFSELAGDRFGVARRAERGVDAAEPAATEPRSAIMAEAKVKAAFSELGIAFEAASHEPVTTVEAGLAAVGGLDCVFAKNLFVKDKKAGCFLLTVAHDTAVNMKSLPALLKTPGAAFRFADEKTLTEKLDVVQGAVTPLAVINDGGGAVKLVLDAKLQGAKKVGVHPLRNDMTVAVAPADLVKFATHFKHEPAVVDFGAAPAAAAAPPAAAKAPKAEKKPKPAAKEAAAADGGKKAGADKKGLEYTKEGNFAKWCELRNSGAILRNSAQFCAIL